MPRTAEEIAEIDAALVGFPIDPVLDLWGRLMEVGGMPPMQPEHFRECALALQMASSRQPHLQNTEQST